MPRCARLAAGKVPEIAILAPGDIDSARTTLRYRLERKASRDGFGTCRSGMVKCVPGITLSLTS
jgi:hypothetical protein